MNRKKIKILIFVVIVALIIKVFYNVKKNNIEDIQRDVNIVNFENNAQLDNPPQNENYGHETGNGVTINLTNRTEFLQKVTNLDYGLSVVNSLNEGFNYINPISQSDKNSTKEYYNKNSEVINILFGIQDYNTFLKFYNDLNNGTITSCTILLNSLKEENNIFKFDIELSGDITLIIPVKVLAKNNDDMLGRLYLYN